MKKRGIILAIIGLIGGIGLGFAILTVENFVGQQLVNLLEEEATKGCSCSFAVDEVRVSLLTLSAVAAKARIFSENGTSLEFNTIEASFGLSGIADKKFYLSELDLIDGLARGVGEESATFRFIDHLSAPLPPEKDVPGRWRLVLQSLKVIDSRFVERLRAGKLVGSEIQLEMERDSNDDFILKPSIGDLSFKLKPTANGKDRTISFGKISTNLMLLDDRAIFKRLRLLFKDSHVKGNAVSMTDLGNRLSGDLRYNARANLLQIADWFRTRLRGKGSLRGSLGNPSVSGSFTSAEKKEHSIKIGTKKVLDFNKYEGSFNFDFNHGIPQFEIHSLKGNGKNSSASLLTPFRIDDETLSGKFNVHVSSFSNGFYKARDIDLNLDVSGTISKPKLSVKGSCGELLIGNYLFPSVDYSLTWSYPKLVFSIKHQGTKDGSLNAEGEIHFPDEQVPRIEKLNFTLDRFRAAPSSSDPDSFPLLKEIKVSGSGTVHGPLDPNSLEGEAALSLSSRHFRGEAALRGAAQVKDGYFTLNIFNESNSIFSRLKLDFRRSDYGNLHINLTDFKPSEYNPDLRCMSFSFDTEYTFLLKDPANGNGDLKVDGLSFGCDPYGVTLNQPESLKIHNGQIKLKDINLSGSDTDLSVNGRISLSEGVDLNAKGSIHLNSLLPLVPSLDDFHGVAKASLDIKGPFNSMVFEGATKIESAGFAVESANFSSENINGEIIFDKDYFLIEKLSGNLNSGSFDLKGELFPLAMERTNLQLNLNNISVEPLRETAFILSGNLLLDSSETAIAHLGGKLTVESGSFEKSFNFKTLLTALSNYIFSPTEAELSLKKLPPIELDVNIEAARNLFIISNLMKAELKADLSVSGLLEAPLIQGEMQTLSGWFGMYDRRFEITSGQLLFRPSSPAPVLDIIGEMEMFTISGDTVFIILEAHGPLTSPEITFSSDRGLSQKEILDLIAIGGITEERTLSRSFSSDEEKFSLIDTEDSGDLARLFGELTTIDELALEPKLNIQNGAIEPAVTAAKYLTERASLKGESFFTGSSKLSVIYQLAPFLHVAGSIDTSSSEENSALGADATFTILSRKKKSLEISIDGNDTFSFLGILENIRINENSRIPPEELGELRKSIKSFYRDHGFFFAKVSLNCTAELGYCSNLTISIDEGPLSYINGIEADRAILPKGVNIEDLLKTPKEAVATLDFLERRRDQVIKRFRSEGYIAVRISAEYQLDLASQKTTLLFDISPGRAVSFTFQGHSVFSAEDFLNTINLLKRRQPFGNNTINILIERIEQLYREAGYLYVTISSRREISQESNRINYIIEIEEADQIGVSRVSFEGNDNLNLDSIKKNAARERKGLSAEIFSPEHVVAEQLEINTAFIKRTYKSEGYPNAKIGYQLISDDQNQSVEIQYLVHEGESLKADWLRIEGYPAKLEFPDSPEAPYSIPTANDYINLLISTLKDYGYLYPAVSSQFDFTAKQLIINIQSGELTTISDIQIEGNLNTDSEIILRHLKIKTGDAWNLRLIREGRSRLLKLGLFTRVNLAPADGELNGTQEVLKVTVFERALQTLEVGGGLNSELGVHVFGEATDKSYFGDGRSFSLIGDLYYDPAAIEVNRGIASLRYFHPNFFSTNHYLTSDLRFLKLDLSTLPYDLNRIALETSAYSSWDVGLTHLFSYTFLREDLENVEPDVVLSSLDEGILDLSYFSGAFTFDQRNSPINPESGYFASIDYKFASEGVGSEADFLSVGGKFSFLLPIPDSRFSFANNTRSSIAWTFDDTVEIPISQRYFTGGRNSIRGFRENSLGPKGIAGNAIGGDLLFTNNFEFRYLIKDVISSHLFLDTGSVFLQSEDVDFDDLRYSTGVGFRYLSPIGPIGLDIGAPLDEQPGEPSVRVHFSIGSTF